MSFFRCQLSAVKGQLFKPRRGLSLIEVVVGLILVSVLVITFGISLVAAVYAKNVKMRNMAHALADQELSVLQTYSASALPIQTNGSMIGVMFTRGTWAASADVTAPSSPNALTAGPVGTTGVTALMPLPNNAYDNFTFSAKMKVSTGAPAGWQIGLTFRAADEQNGYQLYLTANNLYLKKLVNGVSTTLYSDARSISENSWHTLGIVTNGGSMDITLNGTTVTTVADASFSVGKAALAVWSGATGNFDDVTIGGVSTSFDTEAPGSIPDDWSRFGLSNLMDGAGTLTTEQLFGDSNFVKATVNISWIDSQGTKTLSNSTYLRN